MKIFSASAWRTQSQPTKTTASIVESPFRGQFRDLLHRTAAFSTVAKLLELRRAFQRIDYVKLYRKIPELTEKSAKNSKSLGPESTFKRFSLFSTSFLGFRVFLPLQPRGFCETIQRKAGDSFRDARKPHCCLLNANFESFLILEKNLNRRQRRRCLKNAWLQNAFYMEISTKNAFRVDAAKLLGDFLL